MFFRLEVDDYTKEKEWVCYHELDKRGFIYYVKGTKRMQITTDKNIYFYKIDDETFIPELENVMNNYMNCTQMMFNNDVTQCITYKTNQKSFDIYRRKYRHDFRVNIHDENLSGSRGLVIESMNAFVVSQGDTIQFFDISTYKAIPSCKIKIDLPEDNGEREPNEIIAIEISQNQEFMAVIGGQNLIMDIEQPNMLYIFKRVQNQIPGEMDQFELHKQIFIKEVKQLHGICTKFYFRNPPNSTMDPNSIYFATQHSIIELNFETDMIRQIADL